MDNHGSEVEKQKTEEQQTKTSSQKRAFTDAFFDEEDCIIYENNGILYSKILNLSNLSRNCNQFFIIAIYESTKYQDTYFLWERWGRVGENGQFQKKKYTNPESAVVNFEAKFHDKIEKEKYVELIIDYGESGPSANKVKSIPREEQEDKSK